MSNKFAVVEFPQEDPISVGVVHYSWLESRENGMFAYWPRNSVSGRAKKEEMPDKELWKSHVVRILDYAETYEHALAKSRNAELTSNLSNDEEELGRGLRHKKQASGTESDADDEEEAPDTTQKKRTRNEMDDSLPKPPSFGKENYSQKRRKSNAVSDAHRDDEQDQGQQNLSSPRKKTDRSTESSKENYSQALRRSPRKQMSVTESRYTTSSAQSTTPRRESTIQSPTPRRESTTQSPTPRRESTTPRRESTTARRESNTPRRESTTQSNTHRRESTTPRRESTTPRRESTTPRRESTTQSTTPRRESTTPRRESTTPRREITTPRREITTQSTSSIRSEQQPSSDEDDYEFAYNSFEGINLRAMKKVLANQKLILKKLAELESGASGSQDEPELEDLLPTKIVTVEGFEDLHDRMLDKVFRRKLATYVLAYVSNQKTTMVNLRIIFKKIVGNEVLSQYSLRGKKGKKAFQEHQLYRVIMRVFAKLNKTIKRNSIDDCLIEVLKHAPHMPGGPKYKGPLRRTLRDDYDPSASDDSE